jgi:hypothetical protein
MGCTSHLITNSGYVGKVHRNPHTSHKAREGPKPSTLTNLALMRLLNALLHTVYVQVLTWRNRIGYPAHPGYTRCTWARGGWRNLFLQSNQAYSASYEFTKHVDWWHGCNKTFNKAQARGNQLKTFHRQDKGIIWSSSQAKHGDGVDLPGTYCDKRGEEKFAVKLQNVSFPRVIKIWSASQT